jgi:hypothetical protein
MAHLATAADDDKLRRDRMALHQAVGLEARETTSKHVRAVPPERR